MMRRTFLGVLAGILGLEKASKRITPLPGVPEDTIDVVYVDPESDRHFRHDWLPFPEPSSATKKTRNVLVRGQVCAHPDCYAYRIENGGHLRQEEYTPTDGFPIRFQHLDFHELSEHIIAYVDKTGASILSSDDPRTLAIGFLADTEDPAKAPHWAISLTKIKAIGIVKDEATQQILKHLRTPDGRVLLATSFQDAGLKRRQKRLGRSFLA